MAATSGLRRVVTVGGGFAGLFAARALRRAPVQVILIDRAEHDLFQPLLYQCSPGTLSCAASAPSISTTCPYQPGRTAT